MPKSRMTVSEFEASHARASGRSVEQIRELGYVVLRCKCGARDCMGWAMMQRDQAEIYLSQLPGRYGYRYPREGE